MARVCHVSGARHLESVRDPAAGRWWERLEQGKSRPCGRLLLSASLPVSLTLSLETRAGISLRLHLCDGSAQDDCDDDDNDGEGGYD